MINSRRQLLLVLKLLRRRCGETTAEQEGRIHGLPTAQLEELAGALLDFRSAADLATWLINHSGR